jgi:hypothetical protein
LTFAERFDYATRMVGESDAMSGETAMDRNLTPNNGAPSENE